MDRRVTLGAVLVAHHAVAAFHGLTHGLVPVALGPLLNLVILVVVFAGPIAGVVLALRGHPIGLPVFTVSMTGALVLGGTLHFLVENPDHVSHLPASPWRLGFQASAGGLVVTEVLGVAVGARYWRRDR